MSSNPSNLGLFIGHFHPMLVHLPIGALVLLALLELLALFPRFKDAAHGRKLILLFSVAGLIASVACGWLLAEAGDYVAQLLYWHRLTGFAVLGACIISLLLCSGRRTAAYRASLLVTLILLVVAGHFGSSITHGRDFLSRYAPAPLRPLLGGSPPATAAHSLPADPLQRQVFADVIQPILQERCSPCHGPEKQKGELRVDSLAALRQGGQNGPAFVAGKAADSLMIRRLLLPLEHDDHMPPDGKPQPTTAEIGLLQWWIDAGARESGTVGSLKPTPEILSQLDPPSGSPH